ncbi:LysE/ArgO family amino acid transporter [Jatrophihabitans fulvus]
MFAALAAGLLFGLSLIVAVGPQNTFVIRQGLRREHVALVVAVCSASDIALMAGGVGGAGALLRDRQWLVVGVGIVGIAFLLGYGALAARRAWRPKPGGEAATGGATGSARTALAACLAFTWLNPGVYVDTVFLVGPLSNSHGDARWWFGAGAMAASIAWFVAIGFGATLVAPLFDRPSAWRMLDASVAVVMLVTAVRLAVTL